MDYKITIADIGGAITSIATVYMALKTSHNLGLVVVKDRKVVNTSYAIYKICRVRATKGYNIVKISGKPNVSLQGYPDYARADNEYIVDAYLHKDDSFSEDSFLEKDGKIYSIRIKLKRAWLCGLHTYNITLYPSYNTQGVLR